MGYGENVIDQIIKDIKKTHIVLNAEAGHGKSTSLMTIIKRLKEKEPKTIIKVFDVSQAWYHRAPVKWRQKITFDSLQRVNFMNLNDCVYEMGSLTEEFRRFFVAIIVKQDYEVRREMGYRYGKEAVDNLPNLVYIFEEAVRIISNKTDLIHVSLDVDVLDPVIAPGTGIFSRGGLSYREISYIIKNLGKKNVISSLDVIGINPLSDIRNQTSELIVELLITALGGSYGDYERYYLKKQL